MCASGSHFTCSNHNALLCRITIHLFVHVGTGRLHRRCIVPLDISRVMEGVPVSYG